MRLAHARLSARGEGEEQAWLLAMLAMMSAAAAAALFALALVLERNVVVSGVNVFEPFHWERHGRATHD